MDPISAQSVLATAGAAADDATYVDDLFSTFVYVGNTDPSLTITNGIDLSGEGGLVWIKQRNGQREHHLFDTERGATKYLNSRQGTAEQTNTETLTGFTSSGFTLGDDTQVNHPEDFVSWTFRKAPGFFDIVTYTGNGTAGRTVSHNLDSVPGMIIVKCTSDSSTDWTVYHREGHQPGIGDGSYYATFLNTDGAADPSSAYWNNTEPTSTVFTVGSSNKVNGNSRTYVAYLFAHNDARFGTNEDESIVKCARYTGNGGSQTIDLGFEAQWVLIKRQQSSGTDWGIFDIMRGAGVTGSSDSQRLRPNNAEVEGSSGCGVASNGFQLINGSSEVNTSGQRYIYMAIRRPNKPPGAATDVFGTSSHFSGDNSATRAITTGGVTADLILTRSTSNSYGNAVTCWTDRIRGERSLGISSDQSDRDSYWSNLSGWHALDVMDGYKIGGTKYTYSNQTGNQYISFGIKRAPGFFDIVHYTGTGSATTIAHNLGATPSVVLVKGTDTTFQWYWQHYALGANTWVQLNKAEAKANSGSLFNSTLPTSSVFSVGSAGGNNGSGNKYIAYLFGDLDGISKAGTYSGTGYAVNVDCGFAAGARFVLIKRADSAGDWYLYDSVRGIISGNDPYSLINTTNDQVTNTDYIDPLNAGFTVTSSAPAALNTSGGTYLFLAIA